MRRGLRRPATRAGGGGAGRDRHRGPLAARDEHLAEQVGPVGDDPVDAGVEQPHHRRLVVDRPDHDLHADPVRPRHEPFDEHLHPPQPVRHVQELGRREPASRRHTGAGAGDHRGQGAPAQGGPHARHLGAHDVEAPVPRARDADPLAEVLVLQHLGERGDGRALLEVDREPGVGEGFEGLGQRGDRLAPQRRAAAAATRGYAARPGRVRPSPGRGSRRGSRPAAPSAVRRTSVSR